MDFRPKDHINIELSLMSVSDEELRKEYLYQALYVRRGSPPFPRDILDTAEWRKYYAGWGQKDFGIVARVNDNTVGAAWFNLLTGDDPGHAYVDDQTPELTISVDRAHRGNGIGSCLLKALVQQGWKRGWQQLSLSVDKENFAYQWYLSQGWEYHRSGVTDDIFIIKKAPSP